MKTLQYLSLLLLAAVSSVTANGVFPPPFSVPFDEKSTLGSEEITPTTPRPVWRKITDSDEESMVLFTAIPFVVNADAESEDIGPHVTLQTPTNEGMPILTPKPLFATLTVEDSGNDAERVTFLDDMSQPVWMGLPLHDCPDAWSCKNRCVEDSPSSTPDEAQAQCANNMNNSDDQSSFQSTQSHYCHCSKMCWALGDCCQDFYDECFPLSEVEIYDTLRLNSIVGASSAENLPFPEDQAVRMYSLFGTCTNIRHHSNGLIRYDHVWLVSKCPDDFIDNYNGSIVNQCEHGAKHRVFSFPVTHRWNQHLTFKNVFCAMCHGHDMRDITFWTVEIRCHGDSIDPDDVNDADVVIALADDEDACKPQSWPRLPDNAKLMHCVNPDVVFNYVTTCDADYLANAIDSVPAENMANLCDAYVRPVLLNSSVYKNIHCAMCGHVAESDAPNFTCYPNPNLPQVGFLTSTVLATVEYKAYGELVFYKGDRVLKRPIFCRLSDPGNGFLGRCPVDEACPETTQMSIHPGLTSQEVKCAVSNYEFIGYYYPFPRYRYDYRYDYFSVTFEYISQPSSAYMALQEFSLAYLKVIKHNCGYCKAEDIPEIWSIDMDKESLTVKWPTNEPLVTTLKLIKLVKEEVSYMKGDNSQITISNYRDDPDVCSSAPGVVVLDDAFSLTLGFDIYVYSSKAPKCLFNLDQVAFKMVFNAGESSVPTFPSIILCLGDKMRTDCSIETSKSPDSSSQNGNGDVSNDAAHNNFDNSAVKTSTVQGNIDFTLRNNAQQDGVMSDPRTTSPNPGGAPTPGRAGTIRIFWYSECFLVSATSVVFSLVENCLVLAFAFMHTRP